MAYDSYQRSRPRARAAVWSALRRQPGRAPLGPLRQLGQPAAGLRIRVLVREGREPYEDVLAGADRQRGEVVLRVLGDEPPERGRAGLLQHWQGGRGEQGD